MKATVHFSDLLIFVLKARIGEQIFTSFESSASTCDTAERVAKTQGWGEGIQPTPPKPQHEVNGMVCKSNLTHPIKEDMCATQKGHVLKHHK